MELIIANPAARIVEHGETIWIAAGLSADDCSRLRAHGGDEAAAALCRRLGDASIIRLQRSGGHYHSLSAWKGLTSCHEVYFRVAGGETVVADHLRNILAKVPADERAPSDDVLCDHFLFRTIPADRTLCPSVRRLGRGERLDVDLDRQQVRRRLFDRVAPEIEPGTTDSYLARIDQALETVLSPWRHTSGAANLFSGGVDSTLIQSYLNDRVPAVNFQLPSFEAEFEADYADRAARLLDVPLERRRLALDGYLESLEQLIGDIAMPPPHVQLALYQDLFAAPHDHFVIGDQADAVFGIGVRNLKLAAPFRSPWGRRALRAAAAVTRGPQGRRLQTLQSLAAALAQPPDSIHGYAGRFGVYADLPQLERLFGTERLHARLAARLETVLALFDGCRGRRGAFLAHLETAQMIDFLAEDIMMCFRHLAMAHGKTVMSPFMTGPLFHAALTIPAEHRYIRGMRDKYLPKLLLARRVPDYPVDQPKGYSHVSFAEVDRRALHRVWERYDVPQLFNGELGPEVLDESTQTSWNAITLAIWQHRLCAQRDLEPVPGTWRIPTAAETPARQRGAPEL